MQVFATSLPPVGDDLGMFQQIQRVFLFPGNDTRQGVQLQTLGFSVGNQSEIDYIHKSAHFFPHG